MAEFAAKEKMSYIVYDIVVNALRDKIIFTQSMLLHISHEK
jgi:hypothetical protein